MTVAKSTGLFGLKKISIKPLLTDVAGSDPTYGPEIQLTGASVMSCKKNTTEKKSKGDEKVLDVNYSFEDFSVNFTTEEVDFDGIAAVEGCAAAVKSGTPEDTITITESANDTPKYFALMGWAKRGTNTKEVAIMLPKVMGTLSYGLQGEDYAKCTFEGKAIGCKGTINTVVAPSRITKASDSEITFA